MGSFTYIATRFQLIMPANYSQVVIWLYKPLMYEIIIYLNCLTQMDYHYHSIDATRHFLYFIGGILDI